MSWVRVSFRGSFPLVLIEKTIHFIYDRCELLRIFFLLRHILQMLPALGFVD